MKKIAIYDFDGTITKRDSFMPFLLHCFGWQIFLLKIIKLLPAIILFILSINSRNKLKSDFIYVFFKNISVDFVAKKGESYSPILIKNTFSRAIENIIHQKKENYYVVLLTASNEIWIKPTFGYLFDKIICTDLEIKNGFFTGKILGKNCRGEEKLKRICDAFDLSKMKIVVAYGDSKSDFILKKVATQFFYKTFNK